MVQSQGKIVALQIRQIPLPSTRLDAYVTFAGSTPFTPGETLTLWQTPVDEYVSPSVLIARSLNVSLLREALVQKLAVVIDHTDPAIVIDPETGAETVVSFVEQVRLVEGA